MRNYLKRIINLLEEINRNIQLNRAIVINCGIRTNRVKPAKVIVRGRRVYE